MIKKLRSKFIVITMCSVALVLLILLGTINIINYSKIVSDADALLDKLADNGGAFVPVDLDRPEGSDPPFSPGGDAPQPPPYDNREFDFDPGRGMSVETPYESRFFSVTFENDGSVRTVSLDRIAAVKSDAAKEMAQNALGSGNGRGFDGDYRYRISETNGGTMAIFLDCQKNLDNIRSFLWASIAVSLAGLAAVFVLVFFISKKAIRPVAESYEKQKVFITDASHELKTPLTIIEANTEVLELESGENEWTRSIRHQVERLASLTENLVTLSRMEEETPRRGMTDFSLSDAVSESVEPFNAPAETQGKRFECDIARGVTLNGDERSIRKMVGLLCDNAVKYASDGSAIKVALYDRSKPTLVFSNSADGLEKGNYDRLFERFYRADSSRSSEKAGYGIGLSVVKAIVEAHKGKITAVSPDGKNLVFTITF